MPIRPLHVVSRALPVQVGYTLRTHRLMQGQKSVGVEPACVVIPENELFKCDVIESPGVGIRLEDGIPYCRLTERRWTRRLAVRVSQWSRKRNLRGSWRFGTEYTVPDDPWAPIIKWATDKAEFNVIHAHTPAACAAAGLRLAQALNCPFVYEVRGFWELTGQTEATSDSIRQKAAQAPQEEEITLANSADAVITLGDTMRNELIRRGVSRDRIHVIGNGVDTTVYAPHENKDKALESELDLSRSFVIGCATNVRRLEGLSTVIQSLALLRNRGRDVVFLLLGDGSALASLKAEAERLNVGHMVRFLGHIPHQEVPRYYSAFDAFVVPRIDAAVCRIVTPLKPLEAMASGLPIVVSDLPALTELLVDRQAGISFRAGDALELAKSIERLQDNPGLCKEMGRCGRSWVEQYRDWKSLAAQSRVLYEDLLMRHKPMEPSLLKHHA